MINDKYKTIKATATGIYKEKGSKFLAFAYFVETENDVKIILSQIRKEYFDARHHCYAYRLGADGVIFRTNDDGEPSGTAGRPIFGQILSHEITNVLIVVVRYFGGIKLGTSGLIHAYKTATADAINNAEIVEKIEMQTLTFNFAYNVMNDVMKLVKDEKIEILEQTMDADCQIKMLVAKSKTATIIAKLNKIKMRQ
jgi:uncharacterized YigZ family protein